MRSYKQLSYEERVDLAILKQSGYSISVIARKMGRSVSTVSRELRRNQAPPGEYWPDSANRKALSRCLRGNMLDRCEKLRKFVVDRLRHALWTPEQIAGYLTHRQAELPSISHETIYSWIYARKQRTLKLWKFLPRHKKKRGLPKGRRARKPRILNRTSIHDRPAVIDANMEFGHWECDTMAFVKNTQHIAVLRERKTMFTVITQLASKRADETADSIIRSIIPLPQHGRRTMTFDNGTEFAKHETINNALGTRSFFCDPYASWQKGAVENTNGRLRRQLPRCTNIKNMHIGDFYAVMNRYNSTPRKKLGWKTPADLFRQNLNFVALQT